MALLEENDILFAYKALGLIQGLSEATRRVAVAIIDHYNKRTGQCDPGIDRLSKMLGISRATVLRATEQLDALGLIEKTSHGGKSHRASYKPNWAAFRAVVDDWDGRMKSGAAPSNADARTTDGNVAGLRPSTSQPCDLQRRNIATQTLRINPSKEPIEAEQVETQGCNGSRPAVRRAPVSLGKASKPTGQRFLLLPIRGGRSISHQGAALDAAERRWHKQAMELGERGYAAIVEWIDEGKRAAATDAEQRRRGDGIAWILEAMRQEALAGQPAGPPGGGSELAASSGDRRWEVRAISN